MQHRSVPEFIPQNTNLRLDKEKCPHVRSTTKYSLPDQELYNIEYDNRFLEYQLVAISRTPLRRDLINVKDRSLECADLGLCYLWSRALTR